MDMFDSVVSWVQQQYPWVRITFDVVGMRTWVDLETPKRVISLEWFPKSKVFGMHIDSKPHEPNHLFSDMEALKQRLVLALN